MEKILLKKSFRIKDLQIINFNSLWGYKGIFTTIRLVGKKPKLILVEEHIKKLNRDTSRFGIDYKLSKEFFREWLMQNGFQGKNKQVIPKMTENVVEMVSRRYIELYEKLIGKKFVISRNCDIVKRINKNLKDFIV